MRLRMALKTHVQRSGQRLFARGSEIALVVCAAMVGLLAGAVVSGMGFVSRSLHSAIYGIAYHDWLSSAPLHDPLLLLGGPVAGGILMGLVFVLLRRRRERAIVDPIEANALYGGRMSLSDSCIVAVQNLISNGFGASVGLEAGYTQLSAGLASKLGSRFHFRREDLRILVGCGAAGAIAAAFNAPLTGAFYAFELIIGTYSAAALAPVVVAAILASLTAHALAGDGFIIDVGAIASIAPVDFLPAVLLGGVCALLGIVIMMGVAQTEQFIRKTRVPAALRPALGGLAVGLLALITPQVLAAGHGAMHLNLGLQIPLATLVMILVLKATASALSIGSGFRGGLFFASLFMGVLIGKIFAIAAAALISTPLSPTIYATIGMSSLAVAMIGGPLTMTFLALELTGDFQIAVLVLAAAISSSFVVKTTFGYSFATWRFHLCGESIRSAHDIGWIRNLTVARLMRPDVKKASASLSLQQFRQQFPLGSAQRAFVVDADERYVGIIIVAEIYASDMDKGAETGLGHFIRYRNIVLQPDMNAKQAAALFDDSKSEALAVVNNLSERRIIGQLSEAHTLRRYSEELDKRRREAVGETI